MAPHCHGRDLGRGRQGPAGPVLRQDSARANYKLVSGPSALPGSSFPGIAVGDTSVRTLPLDAELSQTPKDAVQAVADYLSDANSDAKDKVQDNVFISSMHTAQDKLKESNQNANIKFSRSVDEGQTVALSTPDGGALVTSYVTSTVTSTPKEEGGTIQLDVLSHASAGKGSTTKGVDVVYGEPMVLYVPASGSQDKISMLAADDVFLSAEGEVAAPAGRGWRCGRDAVWLARSEAAARHRVGP